MAKTTDPAFLGRFNAGTRDALELLRKAGSLALFDLQNAVPNSAEEIVAWEATRVISKAIFYLLLPKRSAPTLNEIKAAAGIDLNGGDRRSASVAARVS